MRLGRARRISCTALILIGIFGVSAAAQRADTSALRSSQHGCPGGTGIRISLTSGDTAVGIDRIIDASRPIDTTFVFDIAQRTWSRTNLAATISAGLAGNGRGEYLICAGVTALMPSATLTVRGARGRVHFQASLADLTSALRLRPPEGSSPPRRL